jgi:23S rRNA pseudouridine1911/1915/1917 synthase
VIEQLPASLAGERLDRVVALVAGVSRSVATELVAAGSVTVNDQVVRSRTHRVAADDVIEVDDDALDVDTSPRAEGGIEFAVVHVDDDVIVVDKPAGLVVHPGAGNIDGTLVNALLARYPEIASVGDPERPGIVHRLDKGTSGLLMVARTSVAYDSLVEQLAERRVGRVYRTLVWGEVADDDGVVDAPIGRSVRTPTKMAVSARGRAARTRYHVERRYHDPVTVTELTCVLETGRTHQIRVHLEAIGHPVVGDERYRGVRPGLASPRPWLHAASLSFDHPTTGEPMSFTSPVPADLAAVLTELR